LSKFFFTRAKARIFQAFIAALKGRSSTAMRHSKPVKLLEKMKTIDSWGKIFYHEP